MTQFTEPTTPPFHHRLLSEVRSVCEEARQDRRAVTGAVAALGVGLLLGVFLKPTFADGAAERSNVSGVAAVEPGLVRTDGLDILVSARAPEEGRVPRIYSRLDAPVFGDPGPAPRLRRVSHVVELDPDLNEDLGPDDPEPLFIDPPQVEDCGLDCASPLEEGGVL